MGVQQILCANFWHDVIFCFQFVTNQNMIYDLIFPAYKPCMGDQMTCDNYKCVNQSSVCDGKDDCGDFSDEKGCGKCRCIFSYFGERQSNGNDTVRNFSSSDVSLVMFFCHKLRCFMQIMIEQEMF